MNGLAKSVLDSLWDASGSRADWIVLLDLSMERVGQSFPEARARKLAINRITFTRDMETYQVVMGRKYRVKEWLKRGLQGLVDRDQFFSHEDEKLLGWRTLFKLCILREHRLKPRYGSKPSVDSEFADELKEIDGWLS
jgi:hypothetical protein